MQADPSREPAELDALLAGQDSGRWDAFFQDPVKGSGLFGEGFLWVMLAYKPLGG